MPLRAKLNEAKIQAALDRLPNWKFEDGKLRREYSFADFTLAFGFMAAAATVIQAMDHHPEWTNVYSKVTIALWTHDAGGITDFDVRLAEKLESIAAKLLA